MERLPPANVLRLCLLAFLALGTASCAAFGCPPIGGTKVRMDFRRGDFYAAPFPSVDLADPATGAYDLSHFPGRYRVPMLTPAFDLIEADTDGAGLSSAIFFAFNGLIEQPRLPDLAASTTPGANVQLINVEVGSPDYLRRHPITTKFARHGGPYGDDFLLALLPFQGQPLRPHTLYAALVLEGLQERRSGDDLVADLGMARLRQNLAPDGMPAAAFADYQTAMTALGAAGINIDEVAGLTVFRTHQPGTHLERVRFDAKNRGFPLTGGFTLAEVFPDYCAYEGQFFLPVYQDGTAPYLLGGGRWRFDATGAPILHHVEAANVWLTIPRRAAPGAGWPMAVFVVTGGGGPRAMIDNGQVATAGGAPLERGSGPARQFARAGFAGIAVDGPHSGIRNPLGLDEQLLTFNIFNPPALRDNIRQSAVELALLPDTIAGMSVDVSGCPGAGPSSVGFDVHHLALMGHSMGATIAPLVMALEPRFGAVVLSGAGGSYVENIVHKESPINIRPLAELLLRYLPGRLDEWDPMLSIVQWAADSSDPLAFVHPLIREPIATAPHVLMLQGIVDTYILPPIANATSVGLGLDLGGPDLGAAHANLTRFRSLSDVIALGGGGPIALPAQANRAGTTTAVVVQFPENGILNGHEVAFQVPEARYAYQCFLHTYLSGAPLVPAGPDPRCP